MKKFMLLIGGLIAFATAFTPEQARANDPDYQDIIIYFKDLNHNPFYSIVVNACEWHYSSCNEHLTPGGHQFIHSHISIYPNYEYDTNLQKYVHHLYTNTSHTQASKIMDGYDPPRDIVTEEAMDEWCVTYICCMPWSPQRVTPTVQDWGAAVYHPLDPNNPYNNDPIDYYPYYFKQNSWSFLAGVLTPGTSPSVRLSNNAMVPFSMYSYWGGPYYFSEKTNPSYQPTDVMQTNDVPPVNSVLGVIDDGSSIGNHLFFITTIGNDSCIGPVLRTSIEKFAIYGAYNIKWWDQNLAGTNVESSWFYKF